MLGPIKYLIALAFFWVLRLTEFVITYFTRDGRTPVFDPARYAWVPELESRAPEIRGELFEVLKDRQQIPNFQDVSEEQRVLTQDSGWKAFFFFITGHPVPKNCRRCPQTVAALQAIPGMQNALFSILAPGKHIPEHRGIYKGLLRFHLALIVPREREKVRIHIDHKPYHWTEGRGLFFDDTFAHEVWNETPEERVIVMIDVERPLPFPLGALNRFIIRVISKTSIARKPLEKLNRHADIQLPQPAEVETH